MYRERKSWEKVHLVSSISYSAYPVSDTVNGFSFHPFLPMAASSSGHRRFGVLDDSNDDVLLTGKYCWNNSLEYHYMVKLLNSSVVNYFQCSCHISSYALICRIPHSHFPLFVKQICGHTLLILFTSLDTKMLKSSAQFSQCSHFFVRNVLCYFSGLCDYKIVLVLLTCKVLI